jgi:hypothetical protein
MTIRVLVNFDCYEAGQVFQDWPGGMCDLLIRRGLIEEVKDGGVETAEAAVAVERADAAPRHKAKPKR